MADPVPAPAAAPATRRLNIAATVGVTSSVLSLALSLWATPRFVHGLGDAAYSALAIIVSFTSYFGYLELGFGAPYVREMAMAFAARDTPRAQVLYETAHGVYTRAAAVGTIGILAVGLPYLGTILPSQPLLNQARFGLVITALTFAATMSLSTSRGAVIAAQRTDLYAGVALFIQPGIVIAQVLAITWDGGLYWMFAIQGAGTIALDFATLLFMFRLHPELTLRARFNRKVWSELRAFGLWKVGTGLAQQGQLNGDRILLGSMLPIATLAPYTLAASLAQRVRVLALPVANPFFAAAAQRYRQDGAAGLFQLSDTYVRRVAVLLAMATAGACYLARPFLAAWVGPGYAASGTPVFQTLIVATSFLLLATLGGQITDAANAPRASTMAAIVGVIVSIAVSIPLVRVAGPVGAAVGFLAGSLVQLIAVGWSVATVIGRDEANALLDSCIVRPTLVGAGAYAAMVFLPHGPGLARAIPAALIGSLAGVVVGIVVRSVRREDLPGSLRAPGGHR